MNGWDNGFTLMVSSSVAAIGFGLEPERSRDAAVAQVSAVLSDGVVSSNF